MMKQTQKKIVQSIFILVISFVLTGLVFFLTYRLDNKYVTRVAQPYSLTNGWEYYAGHLYTPQDFISESKIDSPIPIYIGQFGNFSQAVPNVTPFGCATYRKTLSLEENPKGWLLEIPEIFSASAIYVNQELVRAYGDLSISNYTPHVENTLIPLPSGKVELVIQAANYSHYYSGMTYPPLLGDSDIITRTVIRRLLFYGILCFFTLGSAITSLTFWIRRHRKPLYMAYGLLCLFFSIHTAYPFVHWLGLNLGEFFYVIEDTSYFAMLICMILLTHLLSGQLVSKRVHFIFYIISSTVLLLPLIASHLLFPLFPELVPLYSNLIWGFKLIISLYLIVTAFLSLINNESSVWLLAGNGIFGFGIFIDFLTSGHFEPIFLGWQSEYCGFLMVLLFTLLMVRRNHALITENEYLTNNLQEEVTKKTSHLKYLLEERKQFLSAAAHDLKAPASIIQTYIDFIQESKIPLDAELQEYLSIIQNKTLQMRDNIQSLQLFNSADQVKESFIFLDCNQFLHYVYHETLPYTDANGIYYHLRLPKHSAPLYAQKSRLFRVFENIILNAVEHTPLEGSLTIEASYHSHLLTVCITDTGVGISPENLPRLFDYRFSTKSTQGVRGLGLYFVKNTIVEYGGSVNAASEVGKYTSITITLPIAT